MERITAKYLRRNTNEDGNLEVTLLIENYRNREVIKELVKDVDYRIQFNEVKSKRTLEQNALMWAIIHDIAVARGGERATNDDWDIYLEALERAGAKYEYIAVLPKAEKLLKETYRAVKKGNSFEMNGKTFNSYKVYYGSSKMDTKEMTLLLETVLDMAAECGIETNPTF